MTPSSTKPDSGVTGTAVAVIAKETDSCFRVGTITPGIEAFLVTAGLQGGFRSNQFLPRVTTQGGVAVLPVSDQ